jgi:hypothetical protein
MLKATGVGKTPKNTRKMREENHPVRSTDSP